MDNDDDFVDYYAVLQVDADCKSKTLALAYHHLAKIYHPDSGASSDLDKFTEVMNAYRVLRDPKSRADYDEIYYSINGPRRASSDTRLDLEIEREAAAGDADAHAQILLRLYKRRREKSSEAGVAAWSLQEMLACTDDQFDFYVWYLKAKGLLARSESGLYEITIEGVDHVISMSQKGAGPLRIAHNE